MKSKIRGDDIFLAMIDILMNSPLVFSIDLEIRVDEGGSVLDFKL